jgi:hypothetical protein
MNEASMTEAEERVRDYLARIGRRGGLASRRELTRAREEDGRYSRSQKRRIQSRKTLAAARSQITQTFLMRF